MTELVITLVFVSCLLAGLYLWLRMLA